MTFQTSLDGFERRDWDTDPNGQIRMAVVGLGNYGRNVSVPAIEASDHCTFDVGVSGSPETRRAVADEHGVPTVDYEAYAEGAATGEYDGVYVATPNRLHRPHVGAAASARSSSRRTPAARCSSGSAATRHARSSTTSPTAC